MSPPPARTMRGKSACVSAIGASRSTSIIRWYTSNTVSIARERRDMPALLNKPLIGPPWLTAHSHALSTREGMFSKSVASKGRTNAPGLQRSAIAVRADKFRPDRITLTPAWAEASANAAPIPEVAPVIHHILPSDIFIPLMSRHQVASDMASRQRHVCFTPAGRSRHLGVLAQLVQGLMLTEAAQFEMADFNDRCRNFGGKSTSHEQWPANILAEEFQPAEDVDVAPDGGEVEAIARANIAVCGITIVQSNIDGNMLLDLGR